MNSDTDRGIGFLRLIVRLGGAYELLMGLMMFFLIGPFFSLLGAEQDIAYMMFPRVTGVLAVTFGLLMLAAGEDPERYIAIPLVSIILRVLIQVPILLGCLEMPDMALPLAGFGSFDLVFAVVTAWAIQRSGINWRNWRQRIA